MQVLLFHWGIKEIDHLFSSINFCCPVSQSERCSALSDCCLQFNWKTKEKGRKNRKTPRNKKKRVKKKGQQLKKCKLQLVLKRKSSGSAFVNNCCHAEMQFVAKIQRTYLIRWRWWIRKIVVVEWLLFCCCAQNLIARSVSYWRMVLWNDDKVQSFNAAIYCQMAL